MNEQQVEVVDGKEKMVGRTGREGMMNKLMRCGEEEMVEEEEGWWMKGEGLWMYYKRRRVEVAWMSSRLK